jgi:hypothetical protein
MNLFQDEVVAGFDRTAEIFVEIADEETSRSQQEDEPAMGFAHVGRELQRDKQQRGGRTGENASG